MQYSTACKLLERVGYDVRWTREKLAAAISDSGLDPVSAAIALRVIEAERAVFREGLRRAARDREAAVMPDRS